MASLIKERHPAAYRVLCEEPVTFEYKNGGQHTRWSRPTIELAAREEGQLESDRTVWAVNYSPPFQGPFSISTSTTESLASSAERLQSLHSALRLFATLCDSPELQYRTQLQPGDCVVFDNRRVLHARTSFEFVDDGQGDEEKGRWLKGAYTDGDETWSRWRVGSKPSS